MLVEYLDIPNNILRGLENKNYGFSKISPSSSFLGNYLASFCYLVLFKILNEAIVSQLGAMHIDTFRYPS